MNSVDMIIKDLEKNPELWKANTYTFERKSLGIRLWIANGYFSEGGIYNPKVETTLSERRRIMSAINKTNNVIICNKLGEEE